MQSALVKEALGRRVKQEHSLAFLTSGNPNPGLGGTGQDWAELGRNGATRYTEHTGERPRASFTHSIPPLPQN